MSQKPPAPPTAAKRPAAAAQQQPPRVLLIVAQSPQQELNALLQVLGSLGLAIDQRDAQGGGTSWALRSHDGRSGGRVALFPELGIFRVVLGGERAAQAEQLVASYLPVMQADAIVQQAHGARSAMEKSLFAVMAILAWPDATTAMREIGTELFDGGEEAVQQGVVQGLMLLETPDAATQLQAIAARHPNTPIAQLAQRGLAMLAERGLAADTPETLAERAREALDEQNDPEAALELLAPLLDARVVPNPVLLLAARALRALGEFEQLVDVVSRPGAAGPDGPEILTERGLAFERLGRTADALTELRLALELDPNHERAANAVSRIELQVADGDQTPEQQLERLDAALTKYPDDGALYLQRAGLRLQRGQAADALADLKAAEKHGIEDTATLEALRARAALRAGQFADALRAATRAAAHPEAASDRVGLLRGRAYLALQEPERALKAFAITRREEPRLAAEAEFGRAIALETLGRTDEARAAYTRALEHGESAGELVARLEPVVYKDLALWRELTATSVPVADAPLHKTGDQPVDPLFKVCVECGASALARRTSCRDCGGKEFMR